MPAALAAALIAACGIALAVLAGHTEPFGRLASWSDDVQQRMTAQPLGFRRAVVFDIDAETLRRLEHQLGDWPYMRDIYALVTNWLWRSGAHAVVFDIPFHEERTGDRAFAAALNSRTVLAAVPLSRPPARESGPDEGSRTLGVQVAGIDPRRLHSIGLALPLAEFTPAGGARVGVAGAAAQGVGGRVALLHESRGEVLPELALAALLAASGWPQVSVAGGKLAAGNWRWPATDAGEVFLRYPSNAGDLPVLPFYRLALAAAGVPEYVSLAREVRGRTVFIGSTRAGAADRIHTPLGPLAGLHHAALATEMLAQGRVSRPDTALVDSLLFALALALPLCAVARGGRARGRDHIAAGAGALILPAAAGIGLFAVGQVSHWVLAVLAGLLVQCLGTAWWRFGMRSSIPAVSSRSGEDASVRARLPGDLAAVEPAADALVVIHVDPVFRHLVPGYLELCRKDVMEMRSALDAGDLERIRETGHKLKGSGGSFGFDDITRIGAAVEETAKSADGARLRGLIEELARYLERVRPALD